MEGMRGDEQKSINKVFYDENFIVFYAFSLSGYMMTNSRV